MGRGCQPNKCGEGIRVCQENRLRPDQGEAAIQAEKQQNNGRRASGGLSLAIQVGQSRGGESLEWGRDWRMSLRFRGHGAEVGSGVGMEKKSRDWKHSEKNDQSKKPLGIWRGKKREKKSKMLLGDKRGLKEKLGWWCGGGNLPVLWEGKGPPPGSYV